VKQYPFVLEALMDQRKRRVHWLKVLALAQAGLEGEGRRVLMGYVRRIPDRFVNGLSSN
jgi:truncated hemoglobin YjbI